MNNILLVIDMQNDFISGSLGTKEATAIVPTVVDIVKNFEGIIIYTRDTHDENYLLTQEGTFLPVEHCIEGTAGWQIHAALTPYIEDARIINKPTFGSNELANYLADLHQKNPLSAITLVGLCTDICVVTNALLIKTILPEVPVSVIASACAGVTVEKHLAALEIMRSCQVTIID